MATTKRTWLGIKINLIHSRFTIPVDQILSIMESIQFTIKKLPYTTAPNLSKLCGKMIFSTKFALRNLAQLKARNLHKIIQTKLTRDRRIRLYENDTANQEIIFWRNNLIRLNSYQGFAFCILTKSLLLLFLQTQIITPYPHNLLKEGDNIYALNFSVNTT